MPDIRLVHKEKEGWHELDAAAAVQVGKIHSEALLRAPSVLIVSSGSISNRPRGTALLRLLLIPRLLLRCTVHSLVFY